MQTKDEFYNYIDSEYMDKDKGSIRTLTMSEFYDIGLVHRSLPRSQKNWQELAEYVNYPGDGEHYRLATLRYSQSADRQKERIKVQDESIVLEDHTNYEGLYKQKTQIRDIYNAYRSNLREDAREDRFREDFIAAIKEIDPSEFKFNPVIKTIITKPVEAILLLSDMHIGVDCDNFYNTFNSKVAKDRLGTLLEAVSRYCKCFNVCQLNICNLGDLIHGVIHTSARIESEKNIIDQIKTASELISQFLVRLQKDNPSLAIVYRSCTDNHSRITPNLSESLESENLSTLIDWYLEARLAFSPIVFAKDNIDRSLGKFELLNGKIVMFAHGHLENVNKCVDTFASATHQYVDYVLLAHFHASKEKTYGSSKVIVNGSIVGTEEYALSKRLFAPAEQKLLIFEDKNLIDISVNLQ